MTLVTNNEPKFLELNNQIMQRGADGFFQMEKDKEAIKDYLAYIARNTPQFNSVRERIEYLCAEHEVEDFGSDSQSMEEIMDNLPKYIETAKSLDIDFSSPDSVSENDVQKLINALDNDVQEHYSLSNTTKAYYDKSVFEPYSWEELEELHEYAHSFNFEYKSFMQAFKFYTDYAMKSNNKEKYLESFEEKAVVTAIVLSDGTIQSIKDKIEILMLQTYQPATPTYMNAGRARRGEFVSCFLLTLADTTESIQHNLTVMANLSRIGGGVAFEVSNLRSINDPIKGIDNAAKGPLGVLLVAEKIFELYNQLGQRAGSGAGYISCLHRDWRKVIDAKKPHADPQIKLKTLSLGLTIPQIVYDLAERREMFYTFSPYEINKYYGKKFTDIDFDVMYDVFLKDPRITKHDPTPAIDLFDFVAKSQFESGYPYVFNISNANKAHPLSGLGRVMMSNLCVTADTRLHTTQGMIRAVDLFNNQSNLEVLIDDRTKNMNLSEQGVSVQSAIPMQKTGQQSEIYRTLTKDGFEIRTTPYHKFYVRRGDDLIKIQLNQVEKGDRLLIQSAKGVFGTVNNSQSITTGLVDLTKDEIPEYIYWSNEETVSLYLNHIFTGRSTLGLSDSGYATIQLKTGDVNFLRGIQQLLINFGIWSRIEVSKSDQIYRNYILHIDKYHALISFGNLIGYPYLYEASQTDKLYNYNPTINDVIEFDSEIEFIDSIGYEDVYDTTEELYHSLIFNGISTGNCTEISQLQEVSDIRPYGQEDTIRYGISCNLGSNNTTNLMAYAKRTENGFEKVIDESVRSLTQISDISSVINAPEVSKANSELHSIGLGEMDLFGFLASNRISYESFEARDFTRTYFMMKNFYSIKSSMQIAKERGVTFKGFEKSEYASGKYFEKYCDTDFSPVTDRIKELFGNIPIPTIDDWRELTHDVIQYGIYHAYRQCIAPTQSISYVQNATGYIGPVIDLIENRVYGKGKIMYPAPHLNPQNMWFYKSAYETDMYKLIDLVALAQDHIDQAISTILYITSEDTTSKVISYIMYANRKGLKSLYYTRVKRLDNNMPMSPNTVNECVTCSV